MKQKNIAILGGDCRYLSLVKKLKPYGRIYLVGFDTACSAASVALHAVPFADIDVLVFPITGLSDDGEISANFSAHRLYFTEAHWDLLKKETIIFSGISSQHLIELAAKRQLRLIDLFKRDDVAIYNAVPTAEGALMLAIKHMKKMLYQSTVVLLGFGRVGEIVADRFSKLGAKVYVGVRINKDLARANSLGYVGFHLFNLDAYIKATDLFINTIPALILTKEKLRQVKRTQLIIDLASMPGGVDFEFAKKRDLHVIHALGIPGKVAQVSAGEIIADAIIDEMSNMNTEEV